MARFGTARRSVRCIMAAKRMPRKNAFHARGSINTFGILRLRAG